MGSIGRIPVLLSIAAALLVPGRLEAQSAHEREAYFRAVAEYFALPPDEVAILGSWDLPPDEIPVVLFVAARAGVSPEALTALRESGASWASLASRYRIGAAQLHVPLSRSPDGGALAETYRRYAATPAGQWSEISLSDEEIVTLVNVRVLSSVLGVPPDRVLERRSSSSGFAQLYARMIG